MTQSAITIRNLNKTFYLREKSNNSIREKVRSYFSSGESLKRVEALKSINLEIMKGEFFGIIGHNGSGKSTLLKAIIGALKPDKDSFIRTEGKVLRLALGIGFDLNLSARHNIYVNGSIMGLTFKEIGDNFDNIINFAGLSEFVDTPIKFYSSGMISRLSFAISMHVDADILLIDEYFGGVGDVQFREKSTKIFREHILKGKTIVLVSHELGQIKTYCNRVGFMKNGELQKVGKPEETISAYLQSYE